MFRSAPRRFGAASDLSFSLRRAGTGSAPRGRGGRWADFRDNLASAGAWRTGRAAWRGSRTACEGLAKVSAALIALTARLPLAACQSIEDQVTVVDDRVTAALRRRSPPVQEPARSFGVNFTAPFAASAFGETIAAISNGFGLATERWRQVHVPTLREGGRDHKNGPITERAAISTTPSYPRLRRRSSAPEPLLNPRRRGRLRRRAEPSSRRGDEQPSNNSPWAEVGEGLGHGGTGPE